MLQIVLGLIAIGLAIFLWEKFPAFKWVIAILIGAPIVIILLVALSGEIHTYNKKHDEEEAKKPKIMNEFQSVMLGEKFSDLNFRKTLLQMNSKSGDLVYSVNNNEKELSADFVELDKETKSVQRIIHICDSAKYFYDTTAVLNNIGCGDSGEKIIERYGKNNIHYLCWHEPFVGDKGTQELRYFDIPSHNIRYELAKNKVVVLGVVKKEILEKTDPNSWIDCRNKN